MLLTDYTHFIVKCSMEYDGSWVVGLYDNLPDALVHICKGMYKELHDSIPILNYRLLPVNLGPVSGSTVSINIYELYDYIDCLSDSVERTFILHHIQEKRNQSRQSLTTQLVFNS